MRHSIYDDDRPENVRSTIGWTVFALLIGYAVLNAILPNNDLNIITDILLGVMGAVVFGSYFWKSVVALWRGSRHMKDYLIVGIGLSWFSTVGQAFLRVISRLSNFDPAWVNSEFFVWFKLIAVLGAVLHFIPIGAVDGEIPRGNRFGVISAFAVAAAMAVIILVKRPDPRPWIDHLPGWTKDLLQSGARFSAPPDPPA